MNVTWWHFDQSAKQLIVDHMTIYTIKTGDVTHLNIKWQAWPWALYSRPSLAQIDLLGICLLPTHKPRNLPLPRTDVRDSCFRGRGGVRRANVGSRDGGRGLLAPAASAVGLPSVFHMPHAIHDSVTGSQLKSTKLPELYHIVPADSVPTPPLPVMWLMLMVTGLSG